MGRRPWSDRKTVQECNSFSAFGIEGARELIEEMGEIKGFNISYEVAGESVSYTIELTTTPCNYGGRRYWFVCPVCRRRVGKLYRPPEGRYYACRRCYNLTYRSCKKHDKRVDAIIKNPYSIPPITTLKKARLAFKVYDKFEERRRRYLRYNDYGKRLPMTISVIRGTK